MNVLFGEKSIPPAILQSVFGWSEEMIETANGLFLQIDTSDAQDIVDTEKYAFEKQFFDVAEYLFHRTKNLHFQTVLIDHIPDEVVQYTRNVIYKAMGPKDAGTWAEVDLNILWNGIRGVIKHIVEQRPVNEIIENSETGQYEQNIPKEVVKERKEKYGEVVFFTTAIYELVIQLYLSLRTIRYKKLTIPRLYWVRKVGIKGLDVFMQRAPGVFLTKVPKTKILLALAHVMKQLWRLQRNEDFMHRDFHAGNVSFDPDTLDVGIIDFGNACVNPSKSPIAWQANNPDFFPMVHNSRASACSNRSLDVSCIIASVELIRHEYLTAEYKEMLVSYKELLKKAPKNIRAPFEDKKSGLFTTIKKRGKWFIGNNITDISSQHFWTYNMAEIPNKDWFPENFLSRLLSQLPIEDWFPLRKNISKLFDSIAPKPTYFKIKKTGKIGKLVKLHVKHKKHFITLCYDGSPELHNIPLPDLTMITTSELLTQNALAF